MKIGIIGCGNMASVTTQGIHRHNKNIQFKTFDLNQEQSQKLAKDLNGEVAEGLKDVVNVDYLMICCKPQHFDGLAKDLVDVGLEKQIFVSIMASIPIEKIQSQLNIKKVIRLMPSMPMKKDLGIALHVSSNDLSNIERDDYVNLFKGCSEVYKMETQEQFDKMTVISSSGPAFVYYLISSFEEVLKKWDFNSDQASQIVNQLFLGSTMTAKDSDEPIQKLIDKVTSHKGITIEGINSFQKDDLKEIVHNATSAAQKRSIEIATGL